MDGLFSQLVVLGASGMLVTALIVLWRRGVPAYITAYRWQSWLLGGLTGCVAYFGQDPPLYFVAVALILADPAVAELLTHGGSGVVFVFVVTVVTTFAIGAALTGVVFILNEDKES